MALEPIIHEIFEPTTGTWQYVVADPISKDAVIIDPVLDFDDKKNHVSTETADALLALVKDQGYRIVRLLETHVHADHITSANYLQKKLLESQNLRPEVCIGKRVNQVQTFVGANYGVAETEFKDAFDVLLDDDEVFKIGELEGKAMHLPGHTPDHLGYVIGANVFCGDSLFNHDVGSARCDFPGGSASSLYNSARRLLSLPETTRIWTGHDYPPGEAQGRTSPLAWTTVGDQKARNKHLKEGVSLEEFTQWRTDRDSALKDPRLLHQSLQMNVRAGKLPSFDYFKTQAATVKAAQL